MEIQLRATVEVQPMRPIKNITSRRFFAQIISFKPMTTAANLLPQRPRRAVAVMELASIRGSRSIGVEMVANNIYQGIFDA
jgi:hypothetical protein